jgi:hypothetical protein
MSNMNNGTGFWVIVVLMVILSIAAIIEAAIRFIAHRAGLTHTTSPLRRRREATLRHR